MRKIDKTGLSFKRKSSKSLKPLVDHKLTSLTIWQLREKGDLVMLEDVGDGAFWGAMGERAYACEATIREISIQIPRPSVSG